MPTLFDDLAAAVEAHPWIALGVAVVLGAVITAAWPRRRQRDSLDQLAQGQQQLLGALTQITEAQVISQGRLATALDQRLDTVAGHVTQSVQGSTARTAESLGALLERLEAIDRAQGKIERLSSDVLGLQDILANKQTRGAFGEIQLRDIVAAALPPASYAFQVQLSNGRRADCVIRQPGAPGPLVIDSKFPLEPYEALCRATTDREKRDAGQALRVAVRGHIRAIAERYILPGETADQALMFLPSEAVFAELHASHGDLVRHGFEQRVWIVSPATAMAVLTTLRGVMKDARLREEATQIRRELALLGGDLRRLTERAGNLGRHFGQAQQDVAEVLRSAEKAARRADRLEVLDFAPEEGAEAATPAPAKASVVSS